ncbi:MAG: maleylacetoacetate isomerase [Alphaproteobacteria bacterium]|nr:maleylacetoacetate isomerase [Alphaproteobacteria bacterium]
MKLHGYFRSSASYRVRIALGLKGLKAEQAFYHLRKGEQRSADFLKLNPQGLVPAFETDGGEVLTQSLAILEWLDETYPHPSFLPKDPLRRAKVRAFAYAIACEIHPVQNLLVLNAVRALGHGDAEVNEWARRTNYEGLKACEALIANEKGPFCFGDQPTLADICLIPQLGNARRFGADISAFKRILEADAACKGLKAFQDALPENQPDAE